MATVSLIDTGVQLGRTSGQQVKLGSLRDNGYSRTKAGSGYLRVNPFEVEADRAQDPDEAGSEHRLGDWVGYDQNALVKGSNVAIESSYGGADVTWTKPAGYSRAPSILNQKMFAKSSGYTGDSPGETETSTDPLSSPDTTDLSGDGTSHTISLASFAGEWVAIALVATFDDSVTTHEGDSTDTYTPDGAESFPLTGASDGVLVKVYDTTPTITDVDQNPAEGDCFVGNDVDIIIDVSMEGPSEGTLQRETNGSGTWVTVATNVTPGSSQLTDPNRASGNTYNYRLRYNDVSPNQWSNEASHFADCTDV